jgi:hypothetical protein
MKLKITGIEIESERIVSEVYFNIIYKDDKKLEEELKTPEEYDDEPIQHGNLFENQAF